MEKEALIDFLQKKVDAVLIQQPRHFLVDIQIKPTNNIKVYIDGDAGVGIDELVAYNRALYKQLEAEGLFPEGDFSLEVSSPGLGEPLKLHRQYIKNVGRDVEVVLHDGVRLEGRLLEVTPDHIIIEEIKGKGKKAETLQHHLLFNSIKTTKIQIKF